MQSKSNEIIKIPITKLKESSWQGRMLNFREELSEKDYEDVRELSESIYRNGLLNPIIVRIVNEQYELIDGHRRVTAYRTIRRDEIEAIVIETGEKEAQALTIIGNLQRENLTNIELAIAYKKILEAGLFRNRKELAEASGKDQTFISDVMNALDMDSRIVDDLINNKTTNDVRLLKIIRQADKVDPTGKSDAQWELYREVIDNKLSRKEARQLLDNMKNDITPPEDNPYADMPFKINKRNKTISIVFDTEELAPEIIDDILNLIKNRLS